MADEQKVIDAAAGEVDDLRDIIDKQDRNIAELRAAIQVLSDERTAEIDVRSQLQIDLANLRGEIEGNTNGLEEFATLEPHLETLRYGDQSPSTGGTSAIAAVHEYSSGVIGKIIETDATVLKVITELNGGISVMESGYYNIQLLAGTDLGVTQQANPTDGVTRLRILINGQSSIIRRSLFYGNISWKTDTDDGVIGGFSGSSFPIALSAGDMITVLREQYTGEFDYAATKIPV